MTDRVIDAHGLRKRFGDTVAVADLSLSVGVGEVFGFLGPNGAGKTTSIKMLLSLVTPDAGEARVLGAPLGSRKARARVGFLPEHCRFHDCLTARELVRFHGRLHGMRGAALERRIDALLTRVDLLDAADRPLRGYSKGMLQRAGLAQALVNDPQLVFLDEPTSGLDPLGRLLVRDILGELRAKGVSVFLNSHLLGEVEATCDRVAFVKQGRVIHELALGAPAATLEIEIRATPLDGDVLAGLARFGTIAGRPDRDRVRLQVACDDVLPQVARWLVECGAQLFELRSRRKSLEEWFVDVMGEDQQSRMTMPRLFTVAHLTIYDARRRRMLAAAALCGLAFLAVFSTAVFFASREMARNPPAFLVRQTTLVAFSVMGLYAANFLSVLLASLLPVDALSGEIDSGVMQTLASKPLRRSDIVLGKWLGFGAVITVYFLLLSGGVLLATRVAAGYQQLNARVALPLMLLQLILLLTVSIAGGTRFGTVTNGILTLGFYGVAFIGGWVEQIGALTGITSARTLGIAVSLISPPDTLWRLSAYYMLPDVLRTLGATPFSSASIPSTLMVWWAGAFTIGMLALAVMSFRSRQL